MADSEHRPSTRDARLPPGRRAAPTARHRRDCRRVSKLRASSRSRRRRSRTSRRCRARCGEEGDRLIFKILKRGEGAETGQADLALRYDLTVPLARVVAEHRAKLPKFFKRYQIQPVWRADRPQKGRFREFYQCDVDAIGSTSMTVEAELLSAAADVLLKLGFTDFQIVVNHRQAAERASWRQAGVPPNCTARRWSIIDKARQDRRRRRAARSWARRARAEAVARYAARTAERRAAAGGPGAVDGAAVGRAERRGQVRRSRICGRSSRLCQSTQRRRAPASSIAAWRAGCRTYTGAIFEIRVPDLAGSLGGGGRLRQPDRHVLGRRRAGQRHLARARAHPRGDGRARRCSRRVGRRDARRT